MGSKIYTFAFSLLSVIAAYNTAFASDECLHKGLDILRKQDPLGFEIYRSIKPENRPLNKYIECPNGVLDLTSISTFVHEHVHVLDKQLSQEDVQNTYFLVDKSKLVLKDGVFSSLEPWEQGEENDKQKGEDFAQTYLRKIGDEPFSMLLDELNAYTQGLNAALSLPVGIDRVNLTDGVLAMMTFTLRYYRHFHDVDPRFYTSVLLNPSFKNVVGKLLNQAKEEVTKAVDRNDLRINPQPWMKSLRTPELREEWTAIKNSEEPGDLVPLVRFETLAPLLVTTKPLSGGINYSSYLWKNHLVEIETKDNESILLQMDHIKVSEKVISDFIASDSELSEIMNTDKIKFKSLDFLANIKCKDGKLTIMTKKIMLGNLPLFIFDQFRS
jgi:hypothetical protein